MNKIISIGQAAKILGVHVQTLRNWEKSGRLKPDSISPGGTRRYNLERILQLSGKEIPVQNDNRYTVAYARVSSHDQKDDLKRQAQVLELYCAEHGYQYEVLLDPNSDFKRALGVNMIPHVFIIDGNGKIVDQRSGYTEGAEEHLIEKVRELVAEKK